VKEILFYDHLIKTRLPVFLVVLSESFLSSVFHKMKYEIVRETFLAVKRFNSVKG